MKQFLSRIWASAKKRPFVSIAALLILLLIGNLAMYQIEKIPTVACSPCHIMNPYVDGYQHGELLARKHQEAGLACIDCHENGIEDKIQETVWYVTDDFDDPPRKRDFGNDMCLKCHTDLDAIKEKTDYGNGINPHDSHLGDLNCADCHKMHNKSQAACMKCHDFDFLQKLPSEWQTKTTVPEKI